MSFVGDLYSPDLCSGAKGVVLREVRRMNPLSPKVERRNLVRQPRPMTSPTELQQFNVGAHYDKSVGERVSLGSIGQIKEESYDSDHRSKNKSDPKNIRMNTGPSQSPGETQSLTSSPVTWRKGQTQTPLQRYKSVSPTFMRKRTGDKLSPASLRKSVILRSSRKSEPVSFTVCQSCGFSIQDEKDVSVTNKSGKRHHFHGDCFKCSL